MLSIQKKLLNVIVNAYQYFNPKINVSIKTNIFLDKDLFRADKKNIIPNKKKGLYIIVSNNGNRNIIIDHLAIQPYKSYMFPLRCIKQDVAILLSKFSMSTQDLPAVIKPGEIWRAFYIDQTRFIELNKNFKMLLEVYHQNSNIPTTAKVFF